MIERTIERVYYVYVLYWYDMYPKVWLEFDEDGNPYPIMERPTGEADPIVMPNIETLKTIVKARTGKDEWTQTSVNLWRLDNYWIKECILGFDLNLDEMTYKENWKEVSEDGKTYKTYAKTD